MTTKYFPKPYPNQGQGGVGDFRESLLQKDSARIFRQTHSRKDRIPVEQLLMMSG